jgi:fumarate reductase flavoprotein subunit
MIGTGADNAVGASVRPAAELPAGAPAVPVAIVGAGACGSVAALALRALGIEAVLLERDAVPQGSTALSSGFVPAAGTRAQRAAGVTDSAEAFGADIQGKARGQAAPHLVRAYSAASGPALDALEGWLGTPFELLDGFLYPGHHTRRMHSLPARTGAALVGALAAAVQARDVPVLTNARVSTLFAGADGHVEGLAFERPNGHTEHLRCAALLLACNGYGGNRALVRRHLPAFADAPFVGHAGNDGSALGFGAALGAALADLGAAQGHGGWAVPHGVLITWALMTEGAVQVNSGGRRFLADAVGYSEAAVSVLAQPGGTAWYVFDHRLHALAQRFPDFVAAEAAGAVRPADDVAALAQLIGCNAQVLARTVSGTRLAPPYRAIRVTGALFHTQGGIDIDATCRARRAGGSLLPNLWAAGGAARGVSGPAEWGYLSGNGLLSAVAGGWIAAQSIAAHLATQTGPERSA